MLAGSLPLRNIQKKLFCSWQNKILLTAQKKFSIKDFFSKCDQIRRKLRVRSHLMKKSLIENYIFCTLINTINTITINYY